MEQDIPGGDAESTDTKADDLFRLPRVGQGTCSSIALALCKSIVTLHGGRIWSERYAPSDGERFVFTIPTKTRDS